MVATANATNVQRCPIVSIPMPAESGESSADTENANDSQLKFAIRSSGRPIWPTAFCNAI